MPLQDGVTKAILRQSIENHYFSPPWPYQFEGSRQFYQGRKLSPSLLRVADNPPMGNRVPIFGIIDDPFPQQRRPMQTVTGPGTIDNPPGLKRQQIRSVDPAPYPPQLRKMNPALFSGVIQGTVDNPPPLRTIWQSQIYGAWDTPIPVTMVRVVILPPAGPAPPVAPDNPPPLRRYPVWSWGATSPIWAPSVEVMDVVPDNPGPPNLWFNTVYKAWEPPYIPPQQKVVKVRAETGAIPPVGSNDSPTLFRVPVFYEIPDPQPQQARKLQVISGPVAQPPANPPLLARRQPPLEHWADPLPIRISRTIIEFGDAAPAPTPIPTPEEPQGAGGRIVPHSFTRKKCRELLEEIARERAAAQALAAAPKKAVLAAARATAVAVRDACDLCPAEASAALYAEARAVVESLHRLMALDLQSKVLIAQAKRVEREANRLRRMAEEADDDDAISMLLMGM